MAELSRKPVMPAVDIAVHDHAQTDAPAQVYHHNIFLILGHAKFLFGKCDEAGVVIDINRDTDRLRKVLGKRLFACIQVAVVDTLYYVNKAGHTNAHAYNFIW